MRFSLINLHVRKQKNSLLLLIILLFCLPLILRGFKKQQNLRQNAAGNVYYVATNGNDANTGGITDPFRTIQKAVDTVPELADIQIRGGTYNESVYFNKNNITIEGYPGERAIIDESMDVTNWQSIGNNVYKTTFTRGPNPAGHTWPGASAMYTCPNGDPSSGDRAAYLLVDDTYDTDHWLRPLCDGYVALNGQTDFSGYMNLPAGTFSTDVPANYSGDWGLKTSTIWVHLKDSSNPNNHRIRIGKYDDYFYFVGTASGITLRNLTMQMATGAGFYMDGASNNMIIDHNEIRLTKGWTTYGRRYGSGWTIKNNWMHHNEYENIHMESDNAVIENNLIENTITPWTKWGDAGVNAIGNNVTMRFNTIRGMIKSTDPDRCASFCGGGVGLGSEVFEGWNNALSTKFYNNLIYNNASAGISLVSDGSEVYNNIVHDNCGGIGAGWNPDASRNNSSHNNLIYNNSIYNNNRPNCYQRSAGIELATQTQGNQVHNNLVYGNSTDYYNGGTNNNFYANVSSPQTGYGADTLQQIGSSLDPATFWGATASPTLTPVPLTTPTRTPTSSPTILPTGSTVGKTTIGGTVDANAPGYANGSQIQMGGTTRILTSLFVYVSTIQVGSHYQMAVYADSNGYPGTLIAATQIGTVGNGWNTLPITATLQANTRYWILFNHDGANDTVNKLSYDPAPTAQSAYTTNGLAFGTFPQTLGSSSITSENKTYSLYASFVVSPTVTVSPTIAFTRTPTPPIASTRLALTLKLHGIGTGGDNVSPTSGGNTSPVTTSRTVNLEIYNASNQLVVQPTGTITYRSETGDFIGTFEPGNLPSGSYLVMAQTPKYIQKQLPGIQNITANTTNAMSSATLVVGDSNGDGQLSILDYNILIDCYSELLPAKNCSDPAKKASADLTDDGNVNSFDYNLFLRELSVQR